MEYGDVPQMCLMPGFEKWVGGEEGRKKQFHNGELSPQSVSHHQVTWGFEGTGHEGKGRKKLNSKEGGEQIQWIIHFFRQVCLKFVPHLLHR